MVVKPNDKRRGEPPHNAIQRAAGFVSDQQLRGEFDQELRAVGVELDLLVREIQLADYAVRPLGRMRQRSWLLRRLLLVLVRGISRGLPVCLRHFTH